MTSSAVLLPVEADGCDSLNWPAGVNRRLPSGVKVNLRKKEVRLSFAYMLALRTEAEWCIFGEDSMGLTAGSGSDGAGDIDLRSEGDELNDDRRLGVSTGGFIGRGSDIGVPGAEGTGEAPVSDGASATWS